VQTGVSASGQPDVAVSLPELLAHQLLFVTGKGGVGKTTLAAAIGLIASEQGRRTLVCETEPRGDLARAYECGSTPFAGRQVARDLVAMSMDTEASMREYLRQVVKLPGAGHSGPLGRAFDLVANAAPGVREILVIGKLCFEAKEGNYDLVVVDASSTGNVVGQLAAPMGINELIRVGMVHTQTDWMLEILADPLRTGVVLVTTPEEMPVSEAIELAGRLAEDTPVHLACVVANRVLPELFTRSEEQVFEALSTPPGLERLVGALQCSPQQLGEVLAAARLAVTVRRDGAAHLERLRSEVDRQVPLAYLPYLFGRAHGMRAVRQIAQALCEEMAT